MNNEKKKLDCDIVKDLLPLYYDDVVSETTKNAVKDHLGDCESCLKEYRDFCIETPEIKEENTGKRFGKMVNRQKLRQRIKIAVAVIVACLVLAGTYYLLTQVPMVNVDDVEVEKVYLYDGLVGEKFFIIGNLTGYSGPKSSYHKCYTENGKNVYEVGIKKSVFTQYDEKDKWLLTDTIDILNGENDAYDVDVFIYCGNIVWTKEENADDEIPAYVYGYDLFNFGSNKDEFGDSDAASWSCCFDRNTIKTGEGYFQLNHKTEGTIRWNLDGEVIYESKNESK